MSVDVYFFLISYHHTVISFLIHPYKHTHILTQFEQKQSNAMQQKTRSRKNSMLWKFQTGLNVNAVNALNAGHRQNDVCNNSMGLMLANSSSIADDISGV